MGDPPPPPPSNPLIAIAVLPMSIGMAPTMSMSLVVIIPVLMAPVVIPVSTIPVPTVDPPAPVVVLIASGPPIRPRIGRLHPASRDPPVAPFTRLPVPIGPDISVLRYGRRDPITDRKWGTANADPTLPECCGA